MWWKPTFRAIPSNAARPFPLGWVGHRVRAAGGEGHP